MEPKKESGGGGGVSHHLWAAAVFQPLGVGVGVGFDLKGAKSMCLFKVRAMLIRKHSQMVWPPCSAVTALALAVHIVL